MACECGSERIAMVNAKCSDLCQFVIDDYEKVGYVQSDVGIGDGDYIEFDYCLDCGRIQGKFPVETPKKEEDGW